MHKSLFLLTILFVNVLSVVVVIEDLYEEELPDVVIQSLIGGNFTPSFRSGGSSGSTSPDLKSEDQSAGSGAEIQDFNIKYHINDNATHYFVEDPTNQTEGYYIPIGVEYSELNSSRGQTFQHFYNNSDQTYTYNSNEFVNKTGVIDGTDWVSFEEYPNKFIIRLTNGSIYKRDTPNEMNLLIELIGDNSTIWAVGYESYAGVMAFYLNFADLDWGHAQYLWYPRLKNGQLSSFNEPLYAIYPHLYVNYTGTIYDKILNDRSLYDTPDKNPRNTLQFFNTSDTFGLYFTTDNISILSSNWDFQHGFKYNFTDELFHVSNDIRCNDRNFTDIGFAYEITSSPQSDNTPYQPDRFLLSNATREIIVNISQAWEAGNYLDDFYSSLEIISQNNESFKFVFNDMEDAGFTQKYLNLHNQQFPDGSVRLVLMAGMYGYGEYINGSWINIDPTYGATVITDTYDSYAWYQDDAHDTTYTGSSYFLAGTLTAGMYSTYEGFLSWDTGLTGTITVTSGATLYIRVDSEFLEFGEYVNFELVQHYSNRNPYEGQSDQEYDTWGAYSTYSSVTVGDGASGDQNLNVLGQLQYWDGAKGSNSIVKWRVEDGSGCDWGTDDYVLFYESSSSYDPSLTFTYTTNTAPTVAITNDGDAIYAGIEETSMQITYTDAEGYDDLDDVWIDLSNDDFASYDIRLSWNLDTNVLTVTDSLSYLIGTPNDPTESAGGSATGASGYYLITWKFIIDWDTDWNDDDIDLRGDCDDESGSGATAVSDTDTGETFDDELIFYDCDWTLSDSAYSEDGNTDLLDNEWFRGGVDVTIDGYISYEDSTSVHPPTTQVDVELWANGIDEGATYIDTLLGSSGYYYIETEFPTPSTSGLDADYDFEVRFTGWAGNSDTDNIGTHTGNYLCQSSRDNEIPSQTSYTMSSGTYYADITNDGTPTATNTGATDGSGSGLHATPYEHLYRVNAGGWASYTWRAAATYDHPVSTSSQDVDFASRVRDKVGNTGSYSYDNDNTVDLVNPSIDTILGSESSIYLFYIGSGLTGWYGSDMSGAESYSIIGTASDNFGLEVIGGSTQFGETPSDSSPASYILTYTIEAADTGTKACVIALYDQAGNSDTETFTIYEDNVDPSISYDTETETSDYLYAAYGSSSEGVYGSTMPSGVSYLVGGIASDADSGLSEITDTNDPFGDYPVMGGTISNWEFDYTIDAADDGTVVMYHYATDNVGNIKGTTGGYTFYEDNTAPTGITAWTHTDANSGDGEDPQNGYDDDLLARYTWTGSLSDTYGYPSDFFAYNWLGGAYSSWAANGVGYYDVVVVDDDEGDSDVRFRDNVFNILTVDGEDIVIDTDIPDCTLVETRLTGWNDSYHALHTGGTIYYNSGASDYFNLQILNDGMSNSGFRKIVWDTGSDFESSETDYGGLPDSKDFTYTGDSASGNFVVYLYNNAGNIQIIAWWNIIDDTTAPSGGITSDTENSIYLDDLGVVVDSGYYGSNMPTVQQYTVAGQFSDAGSGVSGVVEDDSSFGDNPTADLSKPFSIMYWDLDYQIDAADNGEVHINIYMYDNVGNFVTEDYIFYEDNWNPSPSISDEVEASEYLYAAYGTSIQGSYGSGMDSVQSFTITGYSSDTGSGYADTGFTDDDSSFGDNPLNTGTDASWEFIYTIDAADNGEVLITFTTTDDVGNIGTCSYTFYEDNINPVSTFTSIDESSPYLYWDTSYLWISDEMGTTEQFFTIEVGSSDSSGVYAVEFFEVAWGDNNPINDTSAPYSQQFGVSSNEDNRTMIIKALDNVGNWETTIEIIIIDESGQNVELGVELDSTNEASDYLHHSDSGIDYWYYSDLMGGSLPFTFTLSYAYNGSSGISHVNTTIAWWTDSPSDSVAPYTLDFSITNTDTQTGIMNITIWTNTGINTSDMVYVVRDLTDPTASSFIFDVDSFANDPNFCHTLTPNSTLVNPSDSESGLIPLFLEYGINGSWDYIADTDDLTFEWTVFHGITDQANHSLYVRITDNVGNDAIFEDWVICDTVAPESLILSMDEMYSPNFYDQSIASIANLTITWNETFPYKIDATSVLSITDDNSPSGGSSLIQATIAGESNGWYQVIIDVQDKAGWNDSILVIPTYGYGIIQLDDSLGSDEVDIWFYFYFFKSNGLGLDWKDYNVSYVVDEAWYPNPTLTRIRGGLFAQKFLNFTSSIRFEVRDFFGNLIHNTTYSLPASRDIYIELAVNTFKTVNLYSDIVNMSLVRGSVTYTEQLMPNEIFAWNLYAAEYNLTVYLHKYGSFAYDDEGNQLNNYSVDLTNTDMAIFIRDIYEALCSILLTDQSNNFLDPRGFKIIIEDERIYGDTFLWNDTLSTKNITITDLFGNIVDQDLTTAYSRFIEIALSIWNVKVFNLDPDPIHLHITQNNLNVSEWILTYTVEEFFLKEGVYTMYFYYTDLVDDYVIENGTYVTKVATITSDVLIFVESDDIIAISVSVDVPQPADPNIDITVTQNNTEVIYLVENIRGEVNLVRGEISFIGSFLALAMLSVLIIILLALFLPQRYDQIREKVRDGRIKIYEKGENVKDEYFPEIDF